MCRRKQARRQAGLIDLLLEHLRRDVQRVVYALADDDVAVVTKGVELPAEIRVGVLQAVTEAGLAVDFPVGDQVVGLAVAFLGLVALLLRLAAGSVALRVPLQVFDRQAKPLSDELLGVRAAAGQPEDVVLVVRVRVPDHIVEGLIERTGHPHLRARRLVQLRKPAPRAFDQGLVHHLA